MINIINSQKNSATGYDDIPAIIAKRGIQQYTKPLTNLINKSIENGVFPDELKIAKVILIFKTGDKKEMSNYRPISVLPFFQSV